MRLSQYRDKVAGALYGFCIGDAMGATTEFMTQKQIKEEYGLLHEIIGGGWLNLTPGQVTDDSQMMFCIINALEEVGVDCNIQKFKHAVARQFEAWFRTNPPDVGNTCRDSIIAYIEARHQYFVKRNDDLLGNGGLMRFLPLALLGMLDWNIAQNDITHPSRESARSIQRAQEAISTALMDGYLSDLPKDLRRPLGTCGATLNNALYYQSAQSCGCAIILAVNDGGDADTIAAITGGIYGARVGLDYIAKNYSRWMAQLDVSVKKQIGHSVKVICDLAQKVHPEWFTSD